MQTFVPYPDLRASSVVLDDRRLGKQRVETFQILRALTWPQYAWKNHPAVRMWRGFIPGLVEYGLENCREWTRRGYADSVAEQLVGWSGGEAPVGAPLPPWWGLEALHLSHRSALLRKDPAYYRPLFDSLGNAGEPDDLPYLWPQDVFPRWPVRGSDQGSGVDEAARLLGLDALRPGQSEAARAAASGRDILLVMRPGSGGSTAGLLAGLAATGRTLWISPPSGPQAPAAPQLTLSAPRSIQPSAQRPPSLARPASAEDLVAMRAETRRPEFVFARTAVPVDDLGLVVVDRANEVASPVARGAVPLLVVVPRADATERAALSERFALRNPVWTGGGWDPAGTLLDVSVGVTAPARRRLVVDLVRDAGPALVVTADRAQADRTATALIGAGLRAAVSAPPPQRGTVAAAALGAWRSRRLDALVLPTGARPALGRGRIRLVVDASGGSEAHWRGVLADLEPERSVLVVAPDHRLAGVAGCLRAALLEPFGEPVAVPCGRCRPCLDAD